jgi:antirestriction protein ArdC
MSQKNQLEDVAKMLIEAMEQSAAPWMKPWAASPFCLHNGVTGHVYSGVNILMLALHLFSDPRYCTFKQAKENGWMVKKGSTSSIVKYAAKVTRSEKADSEGQENEEAKTFFLNKWFHVFNFEQIDGAPLLESSEEEKAFNPLPRCEEVLKYADVKIQESKSSDQAFYRGSEDCVYLPDRYRFSSEIDFYRIAFHEMGHATGAKHRLNRENALNSQLKDYAFEELVAEITSFLVGRIVGCGSDPSSNNVSYLNSWIEALKNDHNYIFKACRLADCAMRWILYPEERENSKGNK